MLTRLFYLSLEEDLRVWFRILQGGGIFFFRIVKELCDYWDASYEKGSDLFARHHEEDDVLENCVGYIDQAPCHSIESQENHINIVDFNPLGQPYMLDNIAELSSYIF